MTSPLRRCELAVPASNDRMMEKAAGLDVDLAFLDLEDAVAPSAKPAARGQAVNALRSHDWGNTVRAVRINATDTEWCLGDLLEVVRGAGEQLDTIIVPKVTAPRDVWFVETVLDQLEPELGISEPIGIEVLIEDVNGLINVEAIAKSSRRLEALILGYGDFSASQGLRNGSPGLPDGYPGDMWHYARAAPDRCARGGNRGDRRSVRSDRGRRGLPPSGRDGGAARVHRQVGDPPHAGRARPRDLLPHRCRDRLRDPRARRLRGRAGARRGGRPIDGRLVDAASVRVLQPILDRAAAIGR